MSPYTFKLKKFILTLSLCFFCASSAQAQQSMGSSLINALSSAWVWSPAALALAVGVSPLDGEITDYASKHRPIYGSVERAKNYSDIIAFYIFPAMTLASAGLHYAYTPNVSPWYFGAFIPPTALTYVTNTLVKDGSGRLRPDGSNNQSFPSAHTAIASVLSHEVRYNIQPHTTPTNSLPISLTQEALVFTVAWARMEARKHHLSDVLAGYALGKFFSTWMRGWIFDDPHRGIVYANTNLNDNVEFGLQWSY